MNERASGGGAIAPQGPGPRGEAVRLWKERTPDPGGAVEAARKDELLRLWIRAEANRLTNLRAAQNRRMGTPGPEGSTGKLAFAETNLRIYEFCMELLGSNAMLYGSYAMKEPRSAMEAAASRPGC